MGTMPYLPTNARYELFSLLKLISVLRLLVSLLQAFNVVQVERVKARAWILLTARRKVRNYTNVNMSNKTR